MFTAKNAKDAKIYVSILHTNPSRSLRLGSRTRMDIAIHIERLILEPARQEGFDLAKFEEAWALFEAART